MRNPVNREYKNSVFIDLFGQDVYRMQLFQTLHPEMSDVTSAELKTITLKQVITAETNDIIGQYIIFSHVMDEQIQKYGRTRKAVEETIRICRNRSVLVEYLQEREKEVFDIMITLFLLPSYSLVSCDSAGNPSACRFFEKKTGVSSS